MATFNGTNLRVYYDTGSGDTLIAGEGECSITINHDPRNANTKDSGKWRTSEEGEYSAEVSVSGMVINPGLGENTYIKTLYGILTGGATVEISVKVLGAASWYLYGQFWMTSLEQAGSHQQTQTFNATFQSDGALSEYTAPP